MSMGEYETAVGKSNPLTRGRRGVHAVAHVSQGPDGDAHGFLLIFESRVLKWAVHDIVHVREYGEQRDEVVV
jgi:hypothetical protein